jgi:hypothetical protein
MCVGVNRSEQVTAYSGVKQGLERADALRVTSTEVDPYAAPGEIDRTRAWQLTETAAQRMRVSDAVEADERERDALLLALVGILALCAFLFIMLTKTVPYVVLPFITGAAVYPWWAAISNAKDAREARRCHDLG